MEPSSEPSTLVDIWKAQVGPTSYDTWKNAEIRWRDNGDTLEILGTLTLFL
jgi:hypothetical protein